MKCLPLLLGLLLPAVVVSCAQTSVTPILSQEARKPSFKTQVLALSEGLLFPSESDFPFVWFESHLHQLPEAEVFAGAVGQAGTPVQRVDFEVFFDRYANVEPWMDEGQVAFAQGMQRIRTVFEQHSKNLAVYRVGEVQVHIYIVGVVHGRVVGLQTLSIET